MTNTHANNCLLADRCSIAGTAKCNRTCGAFIALHGMTGRSGRAGVANIPADYRLVTLANSPARASQPDVYRNVDAYVRTFERQFDEGGERIKSLYLYSESPGNGKTSTAVAVLHEYLIMHYIGSLKRNRQPLQRPVYFLDVNNWQTLYNEFNRANIPADVAERASREYYRQMELAKQAQYCVLDDIGIRGCTEAFRADLHSIINARVANGLPSCYTSNLPIEEMAQVFDQRLYDRMRDHCAVLAFKGESKRGMRR